MKTLLIACFLFGITASAQTNYPTTPVSGATTGTENITGTTGTKIQPVANQSRQTSENQNPQTITNNGRNNDGSSTGTTVTGNGTQSDSAPVDDGSPSPSNRGGTMIATPRGR